MTEAYVFQLDCRDGDIDFRRFLDVSRIAGKTQEEYEAAYAAAERMGLDMAEYDRTLTECRQLLAAARISERYSYFGGTYLVKLEGDTGPGKLLEYLRALHKKGELNEFLEKSRI